MGSDLVVALKDSSANGSTLFAVNHHAVQQRHGLQLVPAHCHEPGECVPVSGLNLPQVRQTCTTMGLQVQGEWGFLYGVNEHRVAVGATAWQSRLKENHSFLAGPDLVRLALERSKSAHHACETLTDLLQRYGQKHDHIYLIADCEEAFVLETCGSYWAQLECHHTRAVTGAAMIRQDWSRLAPGLASHVIEKGWWPDDGSKIDYLRAVGENTDASRLAQKRWGRAALTLSEQQGAIDLHFLRRMLADQHPSMREAASTFLVDLHQGDLPIVCWLAFGLPRTAVYFPICLAGELPAGFGNGAPGTTSIEDRAADIAKLATRKESRDQVITAVDRLQARIDQDAEEFLGRALDYQHHGKPHLVPAIATEMMHHHVEFFDKEYRQLFGISDRIAPPPQEPEEVLFFA